MIKRFCDVCGNLGIQDAELTGSEVQIKCETDVMPVRVFISFTDSSNSEDVDLCIECRKRLVELVLTKL